MIQKSIFLQGTSVFLLEEQLCFISVANAKLPFSPFLKVSRPSRLVHCHASEAILLSATHRNGGHDDI